MPAITFRKRQGLAHISTDALPERIVPPFDMRGFAGLFADTTMRLRRKHGGIGFPEVAETDASAICGGNPPPSSATGAFAPVADDKGDDVSSSPTLHHPQPSFPGAFSDKRPDFIDFRAIIRLRRRQRILQVRQRVDFFFDPCGESFARHAEYATDATHTRAFLICPQDFILTFRAVWWRFGRQDANRATIVAEILLIAGAIATIFDNVRTAAFSAVMGNGCRDHVTMFINHVFSSK